MHVIAAFEPSDDLEMAILALEKSGINREYIAAVPMESTAAKPDLLHTVYRGSGSSAFDAAAVVGTICSVLGASFGFELKWGPVLWGLIGLAIGAAIGYILNMLFVHRSDERKPRSRFKASIVLIVRCQQNESRMVSETLGRFSAISIGTLNGREA
ncbi:hypothetical protein PCCS19_49290 [Paenibacillus sp. CCS19]|uniref:hypothetical protein n=1 Tax=Paenibacillus sp. CCS19 TaxID=3158387 RepID=UPI0025617698|nr:hypothetical protein [Paenibacillus cellulosilyticus]GMK41870.1 hypothetical protein PCCS19_49290 [Paenibacillus cellulosilyticus]